MKTIADYNNLVAKFNDLNAAYAKVRKDYSESYRMLMFYKQKSEKTELDYFNLKQEFEKSKSLSERKIKDLSEEVNELRKNDKVIDNLVNNTEWVSEPDVSGLTTFKTIQEFFPRLTEYDKMSYLDQNQFVDYLLSLGMKYKIGSAGDKIFTFKEKPQFLYGMKGNGSHARLGHISEGRFREHGKNILLEKYSYDLNSRAYVNLLTIGDFNQILKSYLGNQYWV